MSNTRIYAETKDRLAKFYRWLATLDSNVKEKHTDLVVAMQRDARDKFGLDFLNKHPRRRNSS